MTRTEADLERDLRAMLHRRALDIPEAEPEVVPSLASRRRRDRRMGRRATALIGIAATVAVALPIAVALVDDDEGNDATAEVGSATGQPLDGEPLLGADGTALRAAAPLFVADGAPGDVALAYLSERMIPQLVRIDGVDQVADTALVRWSALDDAGVGTPGTVELHRVDGRWGVYASTSSPITVDVTMSGETLTGRVTTTDDDNLCVDVLTPSGSPVPGSPFPERNGGSPPNGTAGCAHYSVDIDIVVGLQPVIVRATLVGGGVLAVSETRLDAPLSMTAGGVATTGPPIDRSAVIIQVYNANGAQGIAAATTDELSGSGYRTADPGTADLLAETRVYAQDGFELECEAVRADLLAINSEVDLSGIVVQPVDPATIPVTGYEAADCIVVIGQDFALTGTTRSTSSPSTVITTSTAAPPPG